MYLNVLKMFYYIKEIRGNGKRKDKMNSGPNKYEG